MTIRRFIATNKKLRGAARRIRSLKIWSDSFSGFFPKNIDNDDYWSVKIPVINLLIEGRWSTRYLKTICAQRLIDAAYNISNSKPAEAKYVRVTCCIVLPQMFSSEICVFFSNEYFLNHVKLGLGKFGCVSMIEDRSLCREWGLNLPSGFFELGIRRSMLDDDGIPCFSEHWYYGEVSY